jgi:hypothetical protein
MKSTVRMGLSEGTLRGMQYIQEYRFLTVSQFARVARFSNYHAGDVLRKLESRGIIGYFGYTGIPGRGKTPKCYYLKRKGWEILQNEIQDTELAPYIEVHQEASWTPQMYHRLRLLDLIIALEAQVLEREHLRLIRTFIEYRRVKGTHVRETTDYVSPTEIAENRIVPDAAFILENAETGRRGLFFLEMDMGTERITAPKSADQRATIRGKFEQYDHYLTSGRFAQTYKAWGDFRFFTLLFVTYGEERIENIRRASTTLPERLHGYYRLATFDAAITNFLSDIWLSRSPVDNLRYALVQRSVTTK